MAKSNPSFNKREKEKRRLKKKQEKRERMEARKAEKAEKGGPSFNDMIAYIDENGNFTDTPPDPKKKKEINAEDIVIGVPSARQEPDEPIRKGWVKFFNESKGFGFLIDEETQESIFVHINDLRGPLYENEKVTFEVVQGPKGLNAINVELA